MHPIYLVARRDYAAYVGAWGFWISLITAPLLIALIIFAPILLARAEPSRVVLIASGQASDRLAVEEAFLGRARIEARTEIAAYLGATAPAIVDEALAAFDAESDRRSAIAAARLVVSDRASGAMRAFPRPVPRYIAVEAPSRNIADLRPYLAEGRTLRVEGESQPVFGALLITREGNRPDLAYWSANLSHDEPSTIARQALSRVMRQEALAARGLSAEETDAIDDLSPDVQRFDPRPSSGGGEVTLRQRAPIYAAMFLAFVLWSAVFGISNLLLTGIIEEKSNKILDTLLTSVSPLDLLIGKLLGAAAVSLTLFAIWGILGGSLLNAVAARGSEGFMAQIAAAFLDQRLLTAFLAGFIVGYLMYGAIFVAIGSLCETIQESQTLVGPVALLLSVPMMLVAPAIDNPHAPIIVWASWFPLFTPFLLMIRAPTGISMAEIIGLSIVMLAALAIVLWAAARVFRAGAAAQADLAVLRRRLMPWRKAAA